MNIYQRILQSILLGRNEEKLNTASLSPPRPDVDSLTMFARNVKTKLDVMDGSSGSGLDKAITYRDLYEFGLLGVDQNGQVLFGGGANPNANGNILIVGGGGGGGEAEPVDLSAPPAPTNLVVTAGLTSIFLEWDDPPSSYRNYAFTEIFRNTTDNLGSAVKVAQSVPSLYSDPVGFTGVTYFYWIRFVSKAEVAGDYNSVSGKQAKTGTIGSLDLSDQIITANKLASGAIQSFDVFGGSIQPIQTVATLPSPTNYMGATTVFNQADGKLYRYVNGVFTSAVPTFDLSGLIAGTQITDAAITSAKLGDSAVTTAKIADNSISTIKIGTAAITSTRIADNAITTPKIAANAVTANQIAANTITGDRIAAGTIAAANIASGTITADRIATGTITAASGVIANAAITNALIDNAAITTAKIADAAIVTAKIGTGQITTALIGDAQITNAKIADLQVTNAKIADATILAAKIGDAQITTAKIANASITNAKINDLDASKINAGVISADRIGANSITATKLSVSSLSSITATIGTLRTATTGQRTEISDNVIKVFDSNGTLRVRIGNLSL